MNNKKICIVNSYLDGRERDCEKGLYPRHQLWGSDYLAQHGYDVTTLSTGSRQMLSRFSRKLTAATRLRVGNVEQEMQLIKHLRDVDFVYGVTAWDLFTLIWLRSLRLIRAKVVVWIYSPQIKMPWLHELLRPSVFNRGFDGVLCLTQKTAACYKQLASRASIRKIDWGADLGLFKHYGKKGDYFLACGRTQRDYDTLLKAAAQVDFPIKLIVPQSTFKDRVLPPNVEIAGGPKSPADDRGIPYPELIEKYYAACRAVLVPLHDDPNNTAGFTNVIEAFAVGKPVIMTQTGCLDVDLTANNVGLYVKPGDSDGWVKAMRTFADNPALASEMGQRARAQAEKHYNTDRFGREVCEFFDSLSNTN
jgi:glycosyltransferase involved in cell wall biosynthesis